MKGEILSHSWIKLRDKIAKAPLQKTIKFFSQYSWHLVLVAVKKEAMSRGGRKVLKEILNKEEPLVMPRRKQNKMIIKRMPVRVKSNLKGKMAHLIRKLKII